MKLKKFRGKKNGRVVQFSKSQKLTCDNHEIIITIFKVKHEVTKLWNDSEKRQSSDQTWKMWYLDIERPSCCIIITDPLLQFDLKKKLKLQMNL